MENFMHRHTDHFLEHLGKVREEQGEHFTEMLKQSKHDGKGVGIRCASRLFLVFKARFNCRLYRNVAKYRAMKISRYGTEEFR